MALADLLKIPTVLSYLMDGSVMTVFEAILEKFALPKERAEELLDLTDAVLDGTIALTDVPDMLQNAFGVEEERAKRMACDVVGFRLLPLEEYVPGIVDQLKTWEADLAKYPKSRVGKVKMLPETFAASIDDKVGLNFSEVLVKRCGFLISSYWKGEKTKESTLTFFSRATNIGGLGLTPEKSQELLQAIDGERDLVELVDGDPGTVIENSGEAAVKEIEKTFEIQEETPVVAEQVSTETAVEIAPSHEVAAEVPVVNRPIAAKPMTDEWKDELRDAEKRARQVQAAGGDVVSAYDAAADDAVAMVSSILERVSIPTASFRDVVLKAIRGVRDLYQTRDVLSRDLHLAGEDLEVATEAIEKARSAVMLRDAQDGHVAAVVEPAESPRPNDPTLLDKRFAALAKDAPKERVEEVLPGARVSLARTAQEEERDQHAAIPEEKLVEAQIASRPAPVKPMLTVGSVPPQHTSRILTDVQPVRKLMGPIDELGAMTPQEFRRLSTVPADAVQKILDLLATLESQSYEDRVKGILAWRKSPMNQLYVSMTTMALSQGVAVAEIAAKRRAAGQESLSPAEMRAVGTLNETLRF